MATKKKKTVAVVAAPQALQQGEYTVPAEFQEGLKNLDATGGSLQRDLGRLELDYAQAKARLIERFFTHQALYEKTLKDVAKQGGLDFDKLEEKWVFDLATMTFRREG